MNIEALRKLANQEEIDYTFLLFALRDYARPREKISAFLKAGTLIRVKKGLYIFGPTVARTAYSKEVLANLIYGPSAISLTYALAFHGLIPERVNVMTSITHKRKKNFLTPIGHFDYLYLSKKKYAAGIDLLTCGNHQSFLIASPEKALCDQITLIDQSIKFSNKKAISDYLYYDLRCSKEALKKMNCKKLREIVEVYDDPRLENLLDFLM